MASEETVAEKATETVAEKPSITSYLEPSFTSYNWSDGICNALTREVEPTLIIKEKDLLTFEESLEKHTRSLISEYQFEYAKAEYEQLQKEFERMEAKLNLQKVDEPDVDDSRKLMPPPKSTKTKPVTRRSTRSGSREKEKVEKKKSESSR